MNKRLLLSVLAGAMAVTVTIATATQAAPCKPCQLPPQKAATKPCPAPEMKKPTKTPVVQATKDERKEEFDKRINLSPEQKAALEKIKADEKKTLEPIHKKMEKKRDEMKELTKKEIDVRTQSMKSFEALLTTEQKAELEKMKSEFHEKMQKEFEKNGPHKFRTMQKPECGCKKALESKTEVKTAPKAGTVPACPCKK